LRGPACVENGHVKRVLFLLLLTGAAVAQDVYTPPVPIGVQRDGKVRKARSPIQFPDETATWIRIRSEHYDVMSSATEEETRDIVGDLETLATVLMSTSARFRREGTQPTSVLVFADRKESNPYFELLLGRDKPAATGMYVRYAGGGTMFVDASRRRQRMEKTALHELVHDLLRQGEQVPPLWVEEGLAEYFSNADLRNGRVTAGQPVREHMGFLKRSMPIALEDLFAIPAESEASFTAGFYAESWAAVDWLMRLDHEKFFPFLADLERSMAVADALQKHYGKTLKEMDAAIRNPGSRSSYEVELLGERREVPRPEGLPRAALLYELGRFLSHVAGAEEEAQRHYREALRVDPRHAKSLAAVGNFENAIAAGLDDPDVHLSYAETLLTTALGPFAGIFEPAADDVAKFRKARTLAQRALALKADEGSARAAIGTTYLVETDVSPGIEHLRRAHALLPRRADVALNLYAMLLRTGQRQAADALYAEAFANARDKQLVFAAKNVLLMAETSRANALAKEGRLEEAALIVRALAAATEDATGRRELEQQAAQLEGVANVNKHIRMYNEAIALANTGKNREAVKLLDQLLAVATDALVVRDARKLREEVRKR
jgi:tetratricopeptide (TPR) repeat protein